MSGPKKRLELLMAFLFLLSSLLSFFLICLQEIPYEIVKYDAAGKIGSASDREIRTKGPTMNFSFDLTSRY